MSTPPVPDGPDTELAAAIAWFREDPKRLDFAPITEWSRHLRTIVRAYLARPDGAPQHLVRGDRVETADGVRATVTGPAPRGPNGEPAVNLDWDGDTGGPAYEHDLRRVVDARPAAGRDLTAQDLWRALPAHTPASVLDSADHVVARLNAVARPAVARTDGQPPADEPRAILPHDWARREVLFLAREVVQYRGSQLEGAKLDQLAEAITTLDEKVAEYRASRLTAAPADDTAPAAPEDRINAVRELLAAICDPMDQAEAEAHLDLLGVTRAEVDEANRRTAGQPVRDSQDGSTP